MSYGEHGYCCDDSWDTYHEYDKCGCHEHHEDKKKKCEGCVCDLLKNLHKGTKVDIFLKGSKEIKGLVFVCLNEKNCCASFVEKCAGSILILDCQAIEGIRIQRNCSC
ncbi:hydrolase [Falsibacillus pallidus]|uniref:Spore coat protein Z n=1 Tax=Falsibacillus pallidus TaxID=493781 RepID=A0A370GQ09_9BACI|nr:hydrolase [Falsibacillus pallidus]RDI45601.1 hypothetical protein DFR59_102230 [Falsibacillus pallidus]